MASSGKTRRSDKRHSRYNLKAMSLVTPPSIVLLPLDPFFCFMFLFFASELHPEWIWPRQVPPARVSTHCAVPVGGGTLRNAAPSNHKMFLRGSIDVNCHHRAHVWI